MSRRLVLSLQDRQASICPSWSSTLFKHLLLRNYWTYQSQIPHGAFLGWGHESLLNDPGYMTKKAAMPIYGKNL